MRWTVAQKGSESLKSYNHSFFSPMSPIFLSLLSRRYFLKQFSLSLILTLFFFYILFHDSNLFSHFLHFVYSLFSFTIPLDTFWLSTILPLSIYLSPLYILSFFSPFFFVPLLTTLKERWNNILLLSSNPLYLITLSRFLRLLPRSLVWFPVSFYISHYLIFPSSALNSHNTTIFLYNYNHMIRFILESLSFISCLKPLTVVPCRPTIATNQTEPSMSNWREIVPYFSLFYDLLFLIVSIATCYRCCRPKRKPPCSTLIKQHVNWKHPYLLYTSIYMYIWMYIDTGNDCRCYEGMYINISVPHMFHMYRTRGTGTMKINTSIRIYCDR